MLSGRETEYNHTPLALANQILEAKEVQGKDATEQQLYTLEAIRRLLLRVEAVRAFSWLWHSDAPFIPHNADTERARRTATSPSPLTLVLPTLRRRAGRRRVLLAALHRQSSKP